MNSHLLRACLRGVLGGLIALATAGCKSRPDGDWSAAGPSGSISDINRKMGGRPAGTENPASPTAPPDIVLLVVHDAEGKPQYVEVQRSCGDPATDRRAQDYVLQRRRFPPGAANTITVTVNPKSLPKP
jgi:hypothetical protein